VCVRGVFGRGEICGEGGQRRGRAQAPSSRSPHRITRLHAGGGGLPHGGQAGPAGFGLVRRGRAHRFIYFVLLRSFSLLWPRPAPFPLLYQSLLPTFAVHPNLKLPYPSNQMFRRAAPTLAALAKRALAADLPAGMTGTATAGRWLPALATSALTVNAPPSFGAPRFASSTPASPPSPAAKNHTGWGQTKASELLDFKARNRHGGDAILAQRPRTRKEERRCGEPAAAVAPPLTPFRPSTPHRATNGAPGCGAPRPTWSSTR